MFKTFVWTALLTTQLLAQIPHKTADQYWDHFLQAKQPICAYVAKVSELNPQEAEWWLLTGGKNGFSKRPATETELEHLNYAFSRVAEWALTQDRNVKDLIDDYGQNVLRQPTFTVWYQRRQDAIVSHWQRKLDALYEAKNKRLDQIISQRLEPDTVPTSRSTTTIDPIDPDEEFVQSLKAISFNQNYSQEAHKVDLEDSELFFEWESELTKDIMYYARFLRLYGFQAFYRTVVEHESQFHEPMFYYCMKYERALKIFGMRFVRPD